MKMFIELKSHKQQHIFYRFNMWMWKIHKLVYKTQLHGQRNLGKKIKKMGESLHG
jgi:hypothetical protein